MQQLWMVTYLPSIIRIYPPCEQKDKNKLEPLNVFKFTYFQISKSCKAKLFIKGLKKKWTKQKQINQIPFLQDIIILSFFFCLSITVSVISIPCEELLLASKIKSARELFSLRQPSAAEMSYRFNCSLRSSGWPKPKEDSSLCNPVHFFQLFCKNKITSSAFQELWSAWSIEITVNLLITL